MDITKEALRKILENHKWTVSASLKTDPEMVADDIMNFGAFFNDLLHAEAEAIAEKEPYATMTIADYHSAAQSIWDIANEVYDLIVEIGKEMQ